MADVTQFPDCCGIIVLNKFKGGHPGANPEDCLSPTDCEKFLKSSEQKYFRERSCLLAVLSEPQNEKIGSVFVRRKWELLFARMNPRTGTRIFMYCRDLNYTAAREKRIYG